MRDNPSPIRAGRLLFAFGLGGASFAMAQAVDAGVTHAWPEWARGAWTAALIVSVIAAIFMALNAVGLLTSATLAERGGDLRSDGRTLSVRHFVTVDVGILLVSVALAFWLENAYGVKGERTIGGFRRRILWHIRRGVPAIMTKGPGDNAHAESFFHSLKAELSRGVVGLQLNHGR